MTLEWRERYERERQSHFDNCYRGDNENRCQYGDRECPAKSFFLVELNEQLKEIAGFQKVCVDTRGAAHGDYIELWYAPEEEVPKNVGSRGGWEMPRKIVFFPESLDDCITYLLPKMRDLNGDVASIDLLVPLAEDEKQRWQCIISEVMFNLSRGEGDTAAIAFCMAARVFFKTQSYEQ